MASPRGRGLLHGQSFDEALARRAAEAAFAKAEPHGDNQYKRELGKRVLVRALLQTAQMTI